MNILTDIHSGRCDNILTEIIAAAKARRSLVAGGDLAIGDRVRLIAPISPRYMIGKEGIVSKVNKTTATIILDDKTTRFGASPRVPLSCVEKAA